jgi:AcrR family transcriptional regulator
MGKNSTTKQNIIDAFWSLYTHKDFNKISIKEVALKAGYNRSTFYEYFSGTYEILDTIEKGLIASIDDLPPFSLSSGDFGMSTDRFFGQFAKDYDYYAVLLGERGDLQFQINLKRRIKDILMKELFTSHQKASWKLDFALEYLISGLLGIMCLYFAGNTKVSQLELHKLVKEMLDKGLISLFEDLR